MNLLADQDVYQVTISFLRSLGHDVVPAAQLGLSRARTTPSCCASRTSSSGSS